MICTDVKNPGPHTEVAFAFEHQVEQPFEIVPMVRICTLIMLNLEETLCSNAPFCTVRDTEI